MRIIIKVYKDCNSDVKCFNTKADYLITSVDIVDAIERLQEVEKSIEIENLGIKDEPEDFSGVGNDER